MKPLPFFISAITLALVGCNGSSSSPVTATTGTTTGPAKAVTGTFKVGLVTPGQVNDSGWNALAYAGLQDIKTQLGATVNNTVAGGTQIPDALRSYAQDGDQLVIGHGEEYNDPAAQLAPQFPNTVFLTSSGGKFGPNLGTFRFYLEQGFYVAGVIAGKMTKTNVLGMVGGTNYKAVDSTFQAFVAGAKSVNPSIKVDTIYTGSDSDPNLAKQATETLITRDHSDFIIHQTDDGYKGVFDACQEHHVYCFGTNNDQNSVAPTVVIGSAIIDIGPAFVEVAKDVKAGTFKGSIRLVGMKDDAIKFVWNPQLLSSVPPAVQDLVKSTEADILSGKIVVPKETL